LHSRTSIKEIKTIDSSELKQSIDIYKSSFPSNETRPPEKVVEMLENDKDYHLFVSLNNNSVTGMSLMYVFRSLGIGLLDYIAVIPNQWGSGIGMQLFKFTLDMFSSVAYSGTGLLMEIQRENVANPLESTARKNRIRFYTKAGAMVLEGVNYILPPIHHGIKAEEMYLMIRPLKQIPYLQKESVVQYIRAIYSTIYQYQKNDLLDATSQKMPARIMLSNKSSVIANVILVPCSKAITISKSR
jgi:GNAT superfamily N-acetyltransferase